MVSLRGRWRWIVIQPSLAANNSPQTKKKACTFVIVDIHIDFHYHTISAVAHYQP